MILALLITGLILFPSKSIHKHYYKYLKDTLNLILSIFCEMSL